MPQLSRHTRISLQPTRPSHAEAVSKHDCPGSSTHAAQEAQSRWWVSTQSIASPVLDDSSPVDDELVSGAVVMPSVVMTSVVMASVVTASVVDIDVEVVDIGADVVDAVVGIEPPVALSSVPVCSTMHTPTEHTKGASQRLPVSQTQPLVPGVQSDGMQTFASGAH